MLENSINIILKNQAESGAYIASPNFPTYHYCWFRDSSYMAYAMDLCGKFDSSKRFHEWSAEVILAREKTIRRAIDKANRGEDLLEEDILHTRYTLTGEEGKLQKWENFQLDGFGTWLWSIAQSYRLSGRMPSMEVRRAAILIVEYLGTLWDHPCYDCWEEHLDEIHPHTLAAICGGIEASEDYLGLGMYWLPAAIRRFLEEKAVINGRWVKYLGNPQVDASLLGLAVPYHIFPLDDPRTLAAVAAIENDLRVDGGGVHRYATDVYYGGGEWLLLTSWLGWYYAEAGQKDKGRTLHQWVLDHTDENGWLPEQISEHLNTPETLAGWQTKWGPIANPLLWSHAMWIILEKALNSSEE
jgi:GH15 family glucan-1,4-alpha-glucosidase